MTTITVLFLLVFNAVFVIASSHVTHKSFNCTSLDSPWRQFPGLCRIFEANFLINDTVIFDSYGIDPTQEYEVTFMRSRSELIPPEIFMKIPKLVAFEGQFCQMKAISLGLFKNASSLKKFDVRENEIAEVERDTFDGAFHLEVLKLGRNRIHAIHREAFYWLPELKQVLLNENRLYTIDKHLFSRQTKLEFIDLSHNLLANKYEMVLYFIPKLDISFNSIASAEIEMTVHDIGELSSGCSSDITLANNFLMDVLVTGEAVINAIDLSNNRFKTMERIVLEMPARLKRLNLDSNPFSLISRQDLNRYPHLESLNLRNTSLIFGSNNIFSQLTRLKVLDLSYNRLVSIDMQFFEHLTELVELTLDGNHLSGLNTQDMRVKRSEPLTLSLFDNQFACDEIKRIVRKLIRINAKVKQRPDWDLRRFTSSFSGVECSN